ncbi:hypothetical protein MPER_12303, partial [Moniliophthora perniciosa FA553]
DHCGDWNWRKVVGMGHTLRKRLLNAVKQYKKQLEACKSFSRNQLDNTPNWMKAVEDYEAGNSGENPFKLPESGITLQSVRLELANEENENINNGLPTVDETSAAEFVFFALEVKAQQRILKHDIRTCKSATPKHMTQFVNRRTKLTCQIRRVRALQRVYSPVSLQIFATLPPDELAVNAEDIPLLLPSSLSEFQRLPPYCYEGIADIEHRLRNAQLNESLNLLRHALLVKQRLLRYKKVNARKQGATTRSRNLINRQQRKTDLAASTYRSAWKAMRRLVDDKSKMTWHKLEHADVRCMDDLDEAQKKKKRAAKHKRAESRRQRDAGLDFTPSQGESTRLISWIWEAAGVSGGLAIDQVLHDGLRVEYCKAYAS